VINIHINDCAKVMAGFTGVSWKTDKVSITRCWILVDLISESRYLASRFSLSQADVNNFPVPSSTMTEQPHTFVR